MDCRVLEHSSDDGPTCMGRDESLLLLVSQRPDSAILRTYQWSVPTLSLGYFQPSQLATQTERWRGVPLVRRATGGGAILHDLELTYALAVPSHLSWAKKPADFYIRVHQAITDWIREQGGDAALRGGGKPEATAAAKPFLCFQDLVPEDVVIGNHKVVGSAQRRRPGAVLQHGSILLAASPITPELPGLSQLCGLSFTPPECARQLTPRIADALGFSLHPETWSAEQETIANHCANRYRLPDWTLRR